MTVNKLQFQKINQRLRDKLHMACVTHALGPLDERGRREYLDFIAVTLRDPIYERGPDRDPVNVCGCQGNEVDRIAGLR